MKYMGSKNRIAKHILPIMLEHKTDDMVWVEPFVGGANMIDKVNGKRIGADLNKYLIAMWKKLQKGWDLPTDISKDIRDDCRINKDNYKDFEVGWIGIGCCYNGIFFGGYAGEIVTKTGVKRNYIEEAKRNVTKQLPNLIEVDFVNCSYENLEIPNNSLIYCDPPYENTAKYKVGDFNHVDFWQWCREKAKEGHQVFVSEYNAPIDFKCIWSKEVTTTLNTSKKDTEKLFTYIQP